ncbi:MAG: glutamine--fructose-6-phosphate transaminase (isomerizing) [Faecalicoccus sp.]|nr:glutamine--fructose-6-phosphate transaminase (isomerizing) [Faecalicoccus sp.]
MCGITAYTGKAEALSFLLQGLEKLEYRGYDSAGVTLVDDKTLYTVKEKGRLTNLKEQLDQGHYPQTTGIGHTRWATHGIPSNMNSHPHTNGSNTISIVHNGIIENYQTIKDMLKSYGYHFVSQTDSEVIVHLIDYYYRGDMFEALKHTVAYLEGSFALCVASVDSPDCIYVAKKESPMVLGHIEGASFCASDIPAVLNYTKDICALEDKQMAILKPEGIQVFTFEGKPVEPKWIHIPYDMQAAQKGGFDTFMEKEMYEQPYVISETLRGRFDYGISIPEIKDLPMDWKKLNQVYFIACGTAYHASLYAHALFRKWIDIPAYCMPASEYRYGDYRVDENTLCIFVSQSGETADTLAAMKLAKANHASTLSITNVLGSSLSRLSDVTLYTAAGPEIAVASTKAYTTQLVLLVCLVLKLTELVGRIPDCAKDLIQDLKKMPEYVKQMLDMHDTVKEYALLLKEQKDAYFIGRQLDYFSVLEGALKLKEISYIHADAYFAGELKHGPIALIEKDTVVVALATQPDVAAKTISNIEETIARGSKVILITYRGQDVTGFERVLYVPQVHPILACIPVTILLQEIAYYAAKEKGCDVDKPRNLAKSVTVE